MPEIRSIIFNSGFAESWQISSLMFSLYDEISSMNAEQALLSLAEELYDCFRTHNYKSSFLDFIKSIHGLDCDDYLYNEEKLGKIFNNRKIYWTPFDVEESLKNVSNKNYILIKEDAELIFAYLLFNHHGIDTFSSDGWDIEHLKYLFQNYLKSIGSK